MVDFNRLFQDHKDLVLAGHQLLREKQAMATRNNVPATDAQATSTEVNEFDMPQEFADDPAITVPYTPSATASLSDEEFEDKAPNKEQDELERAKLNPPTGDWKKEDSWEYERQVIADDCMPNDFDPSGRTFLVFKGKPLPREANDLSYEPVLRLRISPDKRYSQSKPTEIDMAHKLYLSAVDMFLEIHKEMFTRMSHLRSMLQHDGYYIRTMNGDNGIIVTGIKLKVYQGRNSK